MRSSGGVNNNAKGRGAEKARAVSEQKKSLEEQVGALSRVRRLDSPADVRFGEVVVGVPVENTNPDAKQDGRDREIPSVLQYYAMPEGEIDVDRLLKSPELTELMVKHFVAPLDFRYINTTDKLRSLACWEYLKNVSENLPDTLAETGQICDGLTCSDHSVCDKLFYLTELKQMFAFNIPGLGCLYDERNQYGDFYTALILRLEQDIDFIQQLNDGVLFDGNFKGKFDNLINSLFLNPNHSLEMSERMITRSSLNVPGENVKKKHKNIEKDVTPDKKHQINVMTPTGVGGGVELLKHNTQSDYTSMAWTSLVAQRNYRHQLHEAIRFIELRMGTMGELFKRKERVNPLFLAWLKVQARLRHRVEGDTRIDHLYFQNLAKDRAVPKVSLFSGRELLFTEQLEKLNGPQSNIGVITLPADDHLMDKGKYKNVKIAGSFDQIRKEFLQVAMTNGHDFYISDDIRHLLAKGCGQKLEDVFHALITTSLYELGFSDADKLTEAQKQSVFFHFIKYRLTDFIIQTLNPATINFSCKDGIDRAGVSSLYFNLMKSIELDCPMSEREFLRGLHAAPMLVKGRHINHHIKMIWNAIDGYIIGKTKMHAVDKVPMWLMKWHVQNAPEKTRFDMVRELDAIIDGLNARLKRLVESRDVELDLKESKTRTLSLFGGKSALEDDAEKEEGLGSLLELGDVKACQNLMLAAMSLRRKIVNPGEQVEKINVKLIRWAGFSEILQKLEKYNLFDIKELVDFKEVHAKGHRRK